MTRSVRRGDSAVAPGVKCRYVWRVSVKWTRTLDAAWKAVVSWAREGSPAADAVCVRAPRDGSFALSEGGGRDRVRERWWDGRDVGSRAALERGARGRSLRGSRAKGGRTGRVFTVVGGRRVLWQAGTDLQGEH